MSLTPKGPRAGASCTNKPTAEPAGVAKEAAAATEPPPPVPSMIREQDRLMPVANVSRIMRRGLPAHAKISDDAKEVVQDCVSEFISFVTGEANERCHTEHRKTVTAEDLVWALDRLGFDDYVGPLDLFLQRMREIEGGGGGGDGGRGPRRGSSLVVPHSAQTIRPAAVYRQPAYAVGPVSPRPVLSSNAAAARFGGRYQMPRGGGSQRSMVPYYGGAAFQAGGGRHGGFYADEANSSNEAPPAPRAGSRR